MFKNLFKGKASQTNIFLPISGEVVPISDVPDPTFGEKMLGDGIAIKPDSGKIYSPIDGKVVIVADTLHAYGFENKDKVEILLHFGLETVELKGECFTSYVKIDDEVKAGDLIAEVDLDKLIQKGYNTITPVVFTSGVEDKKMKFNYGKFNKKDDIIATIK